MEAGRIAVVTAAAGGIGRAIVQQLLAQSCYVIAVDVDEAALAELRCQANADTLETLIGDMTNADAVERVFSHVGKRGSLHILVNGVGSTCGGGIRDLSLAEWQRKFELNLSSVFLCTRAALPLLEAASGDRVIVNVSSTLATVADPTTLAYSAFKAALEQLTRALALELASAGIRAVAVAPGPVAATGGESEFETPEFMRLNPMGRFATADEIAGLVAFLASPAAAYITGEVVRIDGGDAALGAGWGPLQRLLERR